MSIAGTHDPTCTNVSGRQGFYERCVHILSELDDAESSLRHTIVRPRAVFCALICMALTQRGLFCRELTSSILNTRIYNWLSVAVTGWLTWFVKASIVLSVRVNCTTRHWSHAI